MADGLDSFAFTAKDLKAITASLAHINISAIQVSRTLSNAFTNAIIAGKSLDQTLQSVGLSLTRIGLNAALRPLANQAVSLLSGSISSLLVPSMGATGSIMPFADGGVV